MKSLRTKESEAYYGEKIAEGILDGPRVLKKTVPEHFHVTPSSSGGSFDKRTQKCFSKKRK